MRLIEGITVSLLAVDEAHCVSEVSGGISLTTLSSLQNLVSSGDLLSVPVRESVLTDLPH